MTTNRGERPDRSPRLPEEIILVNHAVPASRRVVFHFLVPVHVEVENGDVMSDA